MYWLSECNGSAALLRLVCFPILEGGRVGHCQGRVTVKRKPSSFVRVWSRLLMDVLLELEGEAQSSFIMTGAYRERTLVVVVVVVVVFEMSVPTSFSQLPTE